MNIKTFLQKFRREAAISAIATIMSARAQYYRIPEIRHLRQLVRHFGIDCIFDVGANAGQYATMLRRWVGFEGLIISFEPNPVVADKLEQAARKDPKWIVVRSALSSTSGSISFNVTNDTQFASIEAPIRNENSAIKDHLLLDTVIEVECRTLQSVFEEFKSRYGFQKPMLKMDTQGHDLAVFRSGIEVAPQFVAIQSEMSFVPFYEGVPLYEETFMEFAKAGFILSAIFQNNRGSFPVLREMDSVFINERYASLARAAS
jgi:FkbM family methyltransferase